MASLERHYNLPAPEMTQSLVQETHCRSKSNSDGKNSQAYPALTRVASGLFALRGMLCVAVAAGFSASSLPNTVEAMPLALEKGLRNEAGDLKVKVQAVASRPSRRPGRPQPRPIPRPRHRRHRRWVCRWHRGRRVCGWR
jgi:hypothetical protein